MFCDCARCLSYREKGRNPPYIEHGFNRTLYLVGRVEGSPAVILAVRAKAWWQGTYSNVWIERPNGKQLSAPYGEWALSLDDAKWIVHSRATQALEIAARMVGARIRTKPPRPVVVQYSRFMKKKTRERTCV